MAGVVLPDLPAGSQYELIFVTADTTTAASSNIADYDAFVASEAAPLNSLLPNGVTWNALASTATSPVPNAPEPAGIPVYNTQGQELVSGSPGLYTIFPTQTAALPNYNQFGNAYSGDVWVGTNNNGSAYFPLGASPANIGVIGGAANFYPEGWLGYTQDSNLSDTLPLYGLSSVITVPTPEPATLTLLASALLVFGGTRLGRRQHKAAGRRV